MSGRSRHLLWILPLAVALGAGIWLFVRRSEGPRAEALTPTRFPLVQTIVISGRVVQRRQSQLGSLINGTVADVLVEAGDRVDADALLVRLADDDALAALNEAEAAVAEAEARLVRVQGVGRRMAVEALRQANIEARQADAEYERQVRLFETGAASELTLERARRDRDRTRSQRISASLEAAAAAPKGSDAAVAAAALARAQARLVAAQVALEHTRIRAPTTGMVLLRHVEPGEVVKPGEPLVTFAGDGPLEVQIRPDESNLGLLEIGQHALVSAEAFPAQQVDASVARIAPSVDPIRGTVEVDLTIDDAPDYRPDMTVNVEIEVGRAETALVLPNWAVRELGGEAPWVMVIEDGHARRRPVELGLEGDELVEISSGVSESDHVLPPSVPIEEGDPVRLRKMKPTGQGGS